MNERKRFFLLIIVMAGACFAVAGVTIGVLYRAAISEQRGLLAETVQGQARLIEAVARFDVLHEKVHPGSYPDGPGNATLKQIVDAHRHFKGFGKTGEFTLARREGDQIVFLLAQRHGDPVQPKPIPFDAELAEPMRRALSGLSGTVVGLDYRGKRVLAAYEPVSELNAGIVAKIDLVEVRAPFVRAGILAGLFALLVVFAGAAIFLRITNPIIRRLQERSLQLQSISEALGKTRDELEVRVKERTKELSLANKALKQEINEHAQAKADLAENERKYRTLFESAPAGIIISSFEGDILAINDRLLEMIGYSREETAHLKTKNFYANPAGREHLLEQIRSAGFVQDVELEFLRQNGSILHSSVNLTLFVYGGQEVILTVVEDISERKANLEKLERSSAELRHLSEQLIAAQEKERRRIALELHDSIGQMLSAIRISVNNAVDQVKTGHSLELGLDIFERVISMTRQAIEEVRRITMDLRPSTLDDLGILPTISWFFREYQKVYSGIHIESNIDVRESDVPVELRTPIFRILQESLNNIAKHSRANTVHFYLDRVESRLEMQINDNGKGFLIEGHGSALLSRKGLGLTSMRERARLSGGQFHLDSVKGFGTSVKVSWLLAAPTDAAPDDLTVKKGF